MIDCVSKHFCEDLFLAASVLCLLSVFLMVPVIRLLMVQCLLVVYSFILSIGRFMLHQAYIYDSLLESMLFCICFSLVVWG